ncbi:MAG TPA: M48 family metalloprotease [Rhizomicrobium sp.]|nr:M48 family metalloprotease [Rhizomicrobium sp.]
MRAPRAWQSLCDARAFAAVYLLLNAALLPPFDYYRGYASLIGHGGPDFKTWLVREIVPAAARILAAVLLLWIPYALMRRSPRRWWIYSAALLAPVAFAILVALPVWVDPLMTAYHPLADKALSAEIQSLAARCGVGPIPVLVGGDDTTVVGLGPTNRIILGEDIFRNDTPAEIRMTVGHELKHYVMGDNYKALAIIVVSLFLALWLVDRLGKGMIARWHRAFGFNDLADPASLPLIVLIATAYWLAITPAFNLFARSVEHEADRFGLELTHENHALAQNEAAYITRDHDPPEWDTFFLIFRATHPSDADRIRFANAYRPWAEGKPLVYGSACRPAD